MMAYIPQTQPTLRHSSRSRSMMAYHDPFRISTPYNPQPHTSAMYNPHVQSPIADTHPYTPARSQYSNMATYVSQTQTSIAESQPATSLPIDQLSSPMMYGSPIKTRFGETQLSPTTLYGSRTHFPAEDDHFVDVKTYKSSGQSAMGRSQPGTTLLTLCNALCYDAGDAYIIFEACLRGKLFHVSRRPHERERKDLIKSGSIFVFEENASGMKRWTDGLDWSASRIAGGNFLVYRELPQCAPGEKKKLKRKRSGPDERNTSTMPLTGPQEAYENFSAFDNNEYPTMLDLRTLSRERNLVGSLDESYGFKPDGLIKKTMSMTFNGVTHHLVCYYSLSDIVEGKLLRPGQIKGLQDIMPRPEVMRGAWKGQVLGPTNSFNLGVQYPQQQQQQQPVIFNSFPQRSYYVPSSFGYDTSQQQDLHHHQGSSKRPSLSLSSQQQHFLRMTSAPMDRRDSGLLAQVHYEDYSDPALITGHEEEVDVKEPIYSQEQYGMVHPVSQDGLIYGGTSQHGMMFSDGHIL